MTTGVKEQEIISAAAALVAVRREYRMSYKPSSGNMASMRFREHPGGDYWEEKFMNADRPLEKAIREYERKDST